MIMIPIIIKSFDLTPYKNKGLANQWPQDNN